MPDGEGASAYLGRPLGQRALAAFSEFFYETIVAVALPQLLDAPPGQPPRGFGPRVRLGVTVELEEVFEPESVC